MRDSLQARVHQLIAHADRKRLLALSSASDRGLDHHRSFRGGPRAAAAAAAGHACCLRTTYQRTKSGNSPFDCLKLVGDARECDCSDTFRIRFRDVHSKALFLVLRIVVIVVIVTVVAAALLQLCSVEGLDEHEERR